MKKIEDILTKFERPDVVSGIWVDITILFTTKTGVPASGIRNDITNSIKNNLSE